MLWGLTAHNAELNEPANQAGNETAADVDEGYAQLNGAPPIRQGTPDYLTPCSRVAWASWSPAISRKPHSHSEHPSQHFRWLMEPPIQAGKPGTPLVLVRHGQASIAPPIQAGNRIRQHNPRASSRPLNGSPANSAGNLPLQQDYMSNLMLNGAPPIQAGTTQQCRLGSAYANTLQWSPAKQAGN